eukprot:39298-Chlamydomonas_euryale.AAC.2
MMLRCSLVFTIPEFNPRGNRPYQPVAEECSQWLEGRGSRQAAAKSWRGVAGVVRLEATSSKELSHCFAEGTTILDRGWVRERAGFCHAEFQYGQAWACLWR